jgi:DNA-binding transcriptional ArsR family regulator
MIYAQYIYMFKCLSHRSRLRLMELLAAHGEMTVSEIAAAFQGEDIEDRDPSTISRNLNILRQQGFVSPRREGQIKYYSLNIPKIEEAFEEFLKFLREAKTRLKTPLASHSS